MPIQPIDNVLKINFDGCTICMPSSPKDYICPCLNFVESSVRAHVDLCWKVPVFTLTIAFPVDGRPVKLSVAEHIYTPQYLELTFAKFKVE